jgi:hypothetical protein
MGALLQPAELPDMLRAPDYAGYLTSAVDKSVLNQKPRGLLLAAYRWPATRQLALAFFKAWLDVSASPSGHSLERCIRAVNFPAQPLNG